MPETQLQPVIGVTGPGKGGDRAWYFTRYAIIWAGGRPLRLTPENSHLHEELNGIVIGGGDDIHPTLYESEVLPNSRYDKERDMFELLYIEKSLKQDIPMLAICRGEQLLNTYLGGNLHQDLSKLRRHTCNRWTVLPVKTLVVEPDSRLNALLGTTRCRINSLHSQAINQLGSGLRIAGRDLDNIVQAVEDPVRPFVIGVQWHPEYLLYLAYQRNLFRALVESARHVI
ncbi:gamma-glutamyl-gamma-aminobutyrate hydrolase family protein [Candidatus Methylobacter oryzae]|uniref:Gamma-glutamyl-gamma-aminobutyrate hydrolase family protein n=1 Tax=Candidatus Methylobacter oryzae TaxID=2497749 RepID=A0ABY3CDA4_9GAMM|nr:gamma-glutamyl-gamma-aminobutyrate hydrolase family protein [Candidatus Methylobacter oryzae]TRX00508.1 gamma-glutamyl-gamma-aminobutyrate hydrolase family protein [Candidatus Methylobacter oryzae]